MKRGKFKGREEGRRRGKRKGREEKGVRKRNTAKKGG